MNKNVGFARKNYFLHEGRNICIEKDSYRFQAFTALHPDNSCREVAKMMCTSSLRPPPGKYDGFGTVFDGMRFVYHKLLSDEDVKNIVNILAALSKEHGIKFAIDREIYDEHCTGARVAMFYSIKRD